MNKSFRKPAPLAISFLAVTTLLAQAPPAASGTSTQGGTPLYRVTVVDRTVKAINYQYRSGPTMINFRGTVLLPYAKGEAMVDARQGRVDIDAKIEGLLPTQRFGPEYLTYVLWAITPEGRPHNIGELVSDTSNKAKLHVTTDLQAFALVVTAEPYSAVRMPSDVVVAENDVRPDTLGKIEEVNAKVELLPRGQYTMQVSNGSAPVVEGPKLTMHQYEAATEVYQAQSALSTAASVGAERYAPDVYGRAQQLLTTAQQIQARKGGDYRQVVQIAREAAQTAEDARVIAAQHRDQEQLVQANAELARARADLASAQQARQDAISQARASDAKLAAAHAQAQAAENARVQAESAASAAIRAQERAQSTAAQSVASAPRLTQEQAAENRYQGEIAGQRELRGRLFNEMKSALPTLDSGRGLIANLPDESFRGAAVMDVPSTRVAALGRVLARHPGLMIRVEGYSAGADGEALSQQRAAAVRALLVANGLSTSVVTAAGLGDSRPLGSNSTPLGRRANTRIEIVVTGNSIGSVPLWEQSNLTGSPLTGATAGRAE